MAYIGNTPAESFASFEKQVFTIVNSQTAYTLSHSVVNENDIRLVINNVVQEPGSGKAYTASGTTLTLSAALTNGTDTMYCVFLGRALQTVNPPNASVGSAQVADSLISGKTALGATPADTDELLISDAGTLKRVDYSYLKSSNTPAFFMKTTSTSITNNTLTKIPFNTATIDTDSAVDTSNNRFTVPSGKGGKYYISYSIGSASDSVTTLYRTFTNLYINGSDSTLLSAVSDPRNNYGFAFSTGGSGVMDLSAGDYVEVYAYIASGNTAGITTSRTWLSGYKLIT